MKEKRLPMPVLGLIAGTRGALGAGLALLLGDKLGKGRRKTIGWTLFAIGAASTIPLAMYVLRQNN
jgi:hypothetical protein